MPTRPTTPEQQEDARRLKAIYEKWVEASPAGLPKRTQDDVAEAIERGQSTVTQTLNGKLALNADRASKLAALFGCAVVDFSPTLAAEITAQFVASNERRANPAADTAAVASDSVTVMSVGQVAQQLAEVLSDAPQHDRDEIGAMLRTMVSVGPDVRRAAAIDTLASGFGVRMPSMTSGEKEELERLRAWHNAIFSMAEHEPGSDREKIVRFLVKVQAALAENAGAQGRVATRTKGQAGVSA